MVTEKRLIYANACPCTKCDRLGNCRPGLCEAFAEWWLSPVDAVEVVHGRWEPHYETFDEDKAVGVMGGEYQTGWLCSVCGRYEPTEEPYCNCGAKMDGDGNG